MKKFQHKMSLDLYTAHTVGKQDRKNRRPFSERNDGRPPAMHFTWFLDGLALRLLQEVVTNPQRSAESLSCETLCLYDIFIFSTITRNYIMTIIYDTGAKLSL